MALYPSVKAGTGGGGQPYSAGPGIVISGGVIAATSTLLQDVPQVISGGYIARGGSDGSGGYVYVGQSGATMGVSGNYRVSAGDSAVAVKTNISTGLFLNNNSASLLNSGKVHYSATTTIATLYGSNTSTALRLSDDVLIRHSGDDNYQKAVHEGMSATSNSAGIVQPDNSTVVGSGGTLSINPPETLWTSGNAGSEITYSALDGANVIRAYKNGLLMESGADYVIGSSGIVSYTTPLESSDKAAFEYYPAAPTRNIVPDGGKALKSAEPEDYIIDDGEEEDNGEER